jgi:hypothetical protein
MNDLTTSLGDAIATQGAFLQGWVMVLVGTHLISLLLSVYRQDGKFKIRYESLAIVGSFFCRGREHVMVICAGWLCQVTWTATPHFLDAGVCLGIKSSA